MKNIAHPVYAIAVILPLVIPTLIGCAQAERITKAAEDAVDVGKDAVDAIDEAVYQLGSGMNSFSDGVEVLEGLKENLDNGVYKKQIEDIIWTTGEVADYTARGLFTSTENLGKALVDFTRQRIIEDLHGLKNRILGKPVAQRIAVLSNSQSTSFDMARGRPEKIVVAGWNLNVVRENPEDFEIVIENSESGTREVSGEWLSIQGQYALTIDMSSSGVALKHHDRKLVLNGYSHPFEVAILNSNPPKRKPKKPTPPKPKPIKLNPKVSVSTSPSHARKMNNHDDDIGSDDWTDVRVKYGTRITGGQHIEAWIEWDAYESNKHKKHNDTHLRSRREWHRVWSLPGNYSNHKIVSIDSGGNGSSQHWFNGKLHGPQGYPNTGGMQNIRVTFDGGGGGDRDDQKLTADIVLTLTVTKD